MIEFILASPYRLLLSIVICLCLGLPVAAQEDAAKTKRVYLMGSSLTNQVNYQGLQALAESRGYTHIYGRHMMPGAPIRALWKNNKSGFSQPPFGPCGEALSKYEWDVITLEPREGYDPELQAANDLIDSTLKKSPDVQFYVFAQWPRIGWGSFDKQWLSSVKDIQNNYRLGFESFLVDLKDAHPDMKPPLMIPVGHAFHLLQLKIEVGLVPGMKSIFDGYSDRSHQNHIGEYIVGCTFFSTIYKESPVGLPVEPYGDIAPDLARVIQETVWEAVNAHPQSGVKAEGSFKIITPWFPAAVEGGSFERELHSAFGKAPVTYSLAGGNLPPGMEIAPDGFVRGTAAQTGEFFFTVSATDSDGKQAERELKLNCVAESAPVIPEQELPAMQRGQYVNYPVKVEGGNGDISWRLAESYQKTDAPDGWKNIGNRNRPRMPVGLDLTPIGTLTGTPGIVGTYRVVFLAEDSDPTEPDSAKREFIFDVTPEGPDIGFARLVTEKPVVDGKLDESFWKLDRPVEKIVSGKPSSTAVFDVVWTMASIYIAIKVEDKQIVTDSEEPWNDDSVEVFLDVLNDRQTEYNTDDKRLVVSASGQVYQIGLDDRKDYKSAVQRTDDGYIVEIELYTNREGMRNSENKACGFDIAVNDDNDSGERDGRLVWRGSDNNETDPSAFGTIILINDAYDGK